MRRPPHEQPDRPDRRRSSHSPASPGLASDPRPQQRARRVDSSVSLSSTRSPVSSSGQSEANAAQSQSQSQAQQSPDIEQPAGLPMPAPEAFQAEEDVVMADREPEEVQLPFNCDLLRAIKLQFPLHQFIAWGVGGQDWRALPSDQKCHVLSFAPDQKFFHLGHRFEDDSPRKQMLIRHGRIATTPAFLRLPQQFKVKKQTTLQQLRSSVLVDYVCRDPQGSITIFDLQDCGLYLFSAFLNKKYNGITRLARMQIRYRRLAEIIQGRQPQQVFQVVFNMTRLQQGTLTEFAALQQIAAYFIDHPDAEFPSFRLLLKEGNQRLRLTDPYTVAQAQAVVELGHRQPLDIPAPAVPEGQPQAPVAGAPQQAPLIPAIMPPQVANLMQQPCIVIYRGVLENLARYDEIQLRQIPGTFEAINPDDIHFNQALLRSIMLQLSCFQQQLGAIEADFIDLDLEDDGAVQRDFQETKAKVEQVLASHKSHLRQLSLLGRQLLQLQQQHVNISQRLNEVVALDEDDDLIEKCGDFLFQYLEVRQDRFRPEHRIGLVREIKKWLRGQPDYFLLNTLFRTLSRIQAVPSPIFLSSGCSPDIESSQVLLDRDYCDQIPIILIIEYLCGTKCGDVQEDSIRIALALHFSKTSNAHLSIWLDQQTESENFGELVRSLLSEYFDGSFSQLEQTLKRSYRDDQSQQVPVSGSFGR